MIIKLFNYVITIKRMKYERPTNSMEFRRLLEQNDLNPNQVSKLCGIHPNILYRYYNGEVQKPCIKNLDIVTEAINNHINNK